MSEGAICNGTNNRYLVRVRRSGERRFTLIGKPTRSYRAAVMRLAAKMAGERGWTQGDVAFVSDYYEPVSVLTVRA